MDKKIIRSVLFLASIATTFVGSIVIVRKAYKAKKCSGAYFACDHCQSFEGKCSECPCSEKCHECWNEATEGWCDWNCSTCQFASTCTRVNISKEVIIPCENVRTPDSNKD